MNITLRNVSYNAKLSEETSAFTATLLIDGEVCGIVSNDGHGGANRYSDRASAARLDAYGKTLPPMLAYDMSLTWDADMLVGDALEGWSAERDLRRLLRRKLVYTMPDGKLYGRVMATEALVRLTESAKHSADLMASHGCKVVLNALPFAEALTLFRKTTEAGQ